MPLLLAIETSNPSAWSPACREKPGVALLDTVTRQTLGQESIDPQLRHDDRLVPAIDALTKRLALRPRDLRTIAVSVGPGGFTAVRLAVTTAKMIAEATGAACIPVPTALVAARAFDGPGPVAVALASKNDTAFIAAFDENRRPLAPGAIHDARGFGALHAAHGVRTLLADGHLPASLADAARSRGVVIAPIDLGPESCGRSALDAGLAPVDPAQLLPIYPREPEAVTKWRQLHPGR